MPRHEVIAPMQPSRRRGRVTTAPKAPGGHRYCGHLRNEKAVSFLLRKLRNSDSLAARDYDGREQTTFPHGFGFRDTRQLFRSTAKRGDIPCVGRQLAAPQTLALWSSLHSLAPGRQMVVLQSLSAQIVDDRASPEIGRPVGVSRHDDGPHE